MEQQKLEVDQRAARKVFPIAPDGFIPNSVVRRIIRLIEEEENTVPERHIWRLKWKPPDMIAPNVEDEPGTAKNVSVFVAVVFGVHTYIGHLKAVRPQYNAREMLE